MALYLLACILPMALIGLFILIFTFIVWLAFGRKRSFWAMLKDL